MMRARRAPARHPRVGRARRIVSLPVRAFAHQVEATYRNQMQAPASVRLTWDNLKFAAGLAVRLIWHVGIRADYRRYFWRLVRLALVRGRIDSVFGIGFVAYHLIDFLARGAAW